MGLKFKRKGRGVSVIILWADCHNPVYTEVRPKIAHNTTRAEFMDCALIDLRISSEFSESQPILFERIDAKTHLSFSAPKAT